MTLKSIWSKTSEWLKSYQPGGYGSEHTDVDLDGLISEGPKIQEEVKKPPQHNHPVVVKAVAPADKEQSLQKLQENFNKLVDKLDGINEHLGRQVAQHRELMTRLEKLPEILESFPGIVANQERITDKLFEQLKISSLKEQQFIETMEKIPAETSRQTDALENIDHQLAAAADADVQLAENFKKFSTVLGKLDESTTSQRDSILQMGQTFMTSERYTKYLISKQNKRFVWLFMTSLTICLIVILVLAGIIVYLK